jgi:hypothetical protein
MASWNFIRRCQSNQIQTFTGFAHSINLFSSRCTLSHCPISTIRLREAGKRSVRKSMGDSLAIQSTLWIFRMRSSLEMVRPFLQTSLFQRIAIEFELAHELQIAVDLLQHRIDDQRLAALPAGNDIGVGAGNAVEELADIIGESVPRILRRTPQESVRRRARVRRLREKCFAPHPAGQGEGWRCCTFGCGTIRM